MEDTKTANRATVSLTTCNGSKFTGILYSVDEATGKIVLKSVTTAGAKLYGPQIFYKSDIQVITDSNGMNSNTRSVPNKNECCNFKTCDSEERVSSHSLGLENADGDELANITGEDKRGTWKGDVPEAESEDLFEGNGYIYISKICEEFFDAIVHIMDQDVVGVTFEGLNIGRDGILSLIQIVTEIKIVVFDMHQLGEQAFKEGLQALFEAKNIVKVIHDCRWISDMMHEKYKICMLNVFDTQVANAFVYKSTHNGHWPRKVESLPNCLLKHLNLPHHSVNFVKIGRQKNENDQSVWLQRPLPNTVLSLARKNVSHLIELYKVLNNKLLLEFRLGVELYLNHVMNQNGHLQPCTTSGYYLPSVFYEIPKLVRSTYFDRPGMCNHNAARHSSEGSSMCRTDSEPAVKERPIDNTDCDDMYVINSGNNNSNNLNSARQQDIDSHEKDENMTVSSAQPISEISNSVRHSKLWQAVHAEQNHEMPDLTCLSATPADSVVESDMAQESIPENDMRSRETLKNVGKDLQLSHAAKLDNRRTPSDISEVNESMVTPHPVDLQDTACASSSPKKVLGDDSCIDTGRSLARYNPTNSDTFSVLPAGFGGIRVSRKVLWDIEKKKKAENSLELNETNFLPALLRDDDLGTESLQDDDLAYIPRQSSVTSHQEIPPGMTCGIADPITDTECSLQQSKSHDSLIKSNLACNNQNSMEDADIEHFQQSKLFQNTLKIAASFSDDNLMRKLLPPKTSPLRNSLSPGTKTN